MGWIKERIISEYIKHGNSIDWALIAEKKIIAEVIFRMEHNALSTKQEVKG